MEKTSEDKRSKSRSKPPLVISGRVFCSWNCFTMMRPQPEALKAGDLIVWSWSGDSKQPQSKSSGGLLRVSVYDGKTRKAVKVKRTRVHQHLKFDGESAREQKLSALIPELVALKGRTLVRAEGGLEVGPVPTEPAAGQPTSSAPAPAATAANPVGQQPAPAGAQPKLAAASSAASTRPAPSPTRSVAASTAKPERTGRYVQCTLFD